VREESVHYPFSRCFRRASAPRAAPDIRLTSAVSRFERRFEFPNRDIVEVEGVRPARFEGFDPVDVPVGNLQQFRVKGGRWYLSFRAHFRAPHLPFGERTFALSAGAIQLIVSNQIAF